MKIFSYTESPIGRLTVLSDGEALTGLYMEHARNRRRPGNDWARTAPRDPLPGSAPAARSISRDRAANSTCRSTCRARSFKSACGES